MNFEEIRKKIKETGKRPYALTFDDSPKNDRKVINLLDKRGVKGTFYVSGKHFSQPWTLTIYKDHEIGLHGLNHVKLDTLFKKPLRKNLRFKLEKGLREKFNALYKKNSLINKTELDYDILCTKCLIEAAYSKVPTSIAFPCHAGIKNEELVNYVETSYNLYVRRPLPNLGVKKDYYIFHAEKFNEKGFVDFEKKLDRWVENRVLCTYSTLRKLYDAGIIPEE